MSDKFPLLIFDPESLSFKGFYNGEMPRPNILNDPKFHITENTADELAKAMANTRLNLDSDGTSNWNKSLDEVLKNLIALNLVKHVRFIDPTRKWYQFWKPKYIKLK